VLAGALSMLLTLSVYAAEDSFRLLPVHWMWWPALGGLVIGCGGLIVPQALGVGYDTIEALLQGEMPGRVIVGILVVKWIIWSVSLGSGTSGGVLAPLLMMGGALGGMEAMILPNEGVGFWPLVSMGAILGGTMRSPFTGVIFALELTHDVNMLLPLLVAVTLAHGFTVLTLKRSILTEKVSRRGYHLSREYAVDPLEILFVREVMRTNFVAFPANISLEELTQSLRSDTNRRGQRLYPVIEPARQMVGIVTGSALSNLLQEHQAGGNGRQLAEVMQPNPVVAYPDEPLRVVVYRMAETGFTRLPVVEHQEPRTLLGIISLSDLLKARTHHLEEERRRERVLQMRLLPLGRARQLRKTS
jgi:CBS domain-containing protein